MRGCRPARSDARLGAARRSVVARAAELGVPGAAALASVAPARVSLERLAAAATAAATEGAVAEDRDELLELVRQLDALRAELATRDARRWLDVAADRQDAVRVLRAAGDPLELLEIAAEQVSRVCGLPRVVTASVDRNRWKVVAAFFVDDPAAGPLYVERSRGDRPAIDAWPLERELVRRRAAVLVDRSCPDSDLLAGRDAPAPMDAYVASPISIGDRVVAIAYGGGRDLDELDRDALAWTAEAVAAAYERLVLHARLRAQRDQVRQLVTSAGTVMTDLAAADIELRPADARQEDPGGTTMVVAPERRLEVLLTRRELEVLSLMATGVRNGEIAARLVIADGTVKSHVKHILRKLQASNRAEAVARYLHQQAGDAR